MHLFDTQNRKRNIDPPRLSSDQFQVLKSSKCKRQKLLATDTLFLTFQSPVLQDNLQYESWDSDLKIIFSTRVTKQSTHDSSGTPVFALHSCQKTNQFWCFGQMKPYIQISRPPPCLQCFRKVSSHLRMHWCPTRRAGGTVAGKRPPIHILQWLTSKSLLSNKESSFEQNKLIWGLEVC